MQEVLRAILHGLGVKNVTCISTAEDAIRILETWPTDLIFADYRLDRSSGAEFAKLVRASHAEERFVPIIACTADTTPRVVRELRDAGVDEILGKPVSSRAVWTKLTAVVNARRNFVNAPDFFGPDRRRRRQPANRPALDRRTNVEID